jgi:hypothetical protein
MGNRRVGRFPPQPAHQRVPTWPMPSRAPRRRQAARMGSGGAHCSTVTDCELHNPLTCGALTSAPVDLHGLSAAVTDAWVPPPLFLSHPPILGAPCHRRRKNLGQLAQPPCQPDARTARLINAQITLISPFTPGREARRVRRSRGNM